MADSSPEIGITINATDMTSPGIASASKSVDMMSAKFNGLGATVKQLPGHFNKAAAVMNLFGGAASEMGGKTAAVAGKLTSLLSLVMVGGPLGLGIAAVGAALAIYTTILEKLLGVQEETNDEFAELNEHISDQGKKFKPLIDQHGELAKAMAASEDAAKSFDEQFHENFDAKIDMGQKLIEMDQHRQKRAEDAEKKRKEAAEEEQKRQEDEEQRFKDRQELYESLDARIQNGMMEVQEANHKRRVEITNEEADKQMERNRQVSAAIASASGHLTNILMADSEERKRAAISAALDEAQAAIVAKAASGAAKAFEGAQSLPFPANLIVGPIVGATVLAAILAFRSQIKLAQGGLVTGGVPGKDSVPALLMPGERVLSKAQVDAGMGPGGGRVTVVNNYSMLDASQLTRQTRRRNAQVQGNDIEEMASRGMINRRRRR